MNRPDPSPEEPAAGPSSEKGPEDDEPSIFGRLSRRLRKALDYPAVRWAERAVWVGLLVFLLYKLGPQISALTGVGAAGGGTDARTPTFSATTLDGDTIRSSDLRGRVVVVNFWATWCPPCRIEVPSLQNLAESHDGDDVVVLGVSTDVGSERPIRRFLEERDVTYPVARSDRDLRLAFGGITGIPTTVILDRRGRIRHRVVGYFLPPAMKSAVGRLLREEDGVPGA